MAMPEGQNEAKEPKPSRLEEARRIIEEYAKGALRPERRPAPQTAGDRPVLTAVSSAKDAKFASFAILPPPALPGASPCFVWGGAIYAFLRAAVNFGRCADVSSRAMKFFLTSFKTLTG